MNETRQLCCVLTSAASTPPVPAPRQAERHVEGQCNLAPSFAGSSYMSSCVSQETRPVLLETVCFLQETRLITILTRFGADGVGGRTIFPKKSCTAKAAENKSCKKEPWSCIWRLIIYLYTSYFPPKEVMYNLQVRKHCMPRKILKNNLQIFCLLVLWFLEMVSLIFLTSWTHSKRKSKISWKKCDNRYICCFLESQEL